MLNIVCCENRKKSMPSEYQFTGHWFLFPEFEQLVAHKLGSVSEEHENKDIEGRLRSLLTGEVHKKVEN